MNVCRVEWLVGNASNLHIYYHEFELIVRYILCFSSIWFCLRAEECKPPVWIVEKLINELHVINVKVTTQKCHCWELWNFQFQRNTYFLCSILGNERWNVIDTIYITFDIICLRLIRFYSSFPLFHLALVILIRYC